MIYIYNILGSIWVPKIGVVNLPTANLCFAVSECRMIPVHRTSTLCAGWVHKEHMHSINRSPEIQQHCYACVLAKMLRYKPWSHQLAGRLVSLTHAFLMYPIRSTRATQGGKGAFNSVQTSPSICVVRRWVVCQRLLDAFKLMPCSTYFLHTLVQFTALLCTSAFFLGLELEIWLMFFHFWGGSSLSANLFFLLYNRLLPPGKLAWNELKLYYNWASIAPTAESLHTKKSLP